MSNIRDGTTRVYHLKQEILNTIDVLSYKLPSKRVERQIQDAYSFLKMLEGRSYYSCKTIEQLKRKIVKKRNKLKRELAKLDVNTSGHQMTVFDLLDQRTEEEKKKDLKKVETLKEEIHWLHKCLGICKNKDYFK